MKTNWNSGMEYGFSFIRIIMWILGIWPLQKDDLVCTFRWFMVLIVQLLQTSIMYITECATDSFFFILTMHLCGQLKLLRIRFVELGKKMNEKNYYRNALGSWIRRHYELIALAKNIEDSFNINLLIRLLVITIAIAISGMRSMVSIKHQNYVDLVKSIVFVQYYIVQSFLFTHAGDALQYQSESIVSTIYSTTWHELPYTKMRDLILIMMRTRVPLQLTAGKFFYITRRTTTDILKTAMTYISFLQVTMEE
ncbi:odorant receptor 13a-like isoform X2 [Linepithema humile]|uniref:odorant receptor 13a-like isoform X2 n=1 Tax=Linepithema humile TaxID=83485 RepID=UPI00351E2315